MSLSHDRVGADSRRRPRRRISGDVGGNGWDRAARYSTGGAVTPKVGGSNGRTARVYIQLDGAGVLKENGGSSGAWKRRPGGAIHPGRLGAAAAAAAGVSMPPAGPSTGGGTGLRRPTWLLAGVCDRPWS